MPASRMKMERLIVFSRYPVPGKTKTRLIPVLGPEGAANLQRRMTEQTWTKVLAAAGTLRGCGVELRYDGAARESIIEWLGGKHLIRPQDQGDLGERMSAAFAQAFEEGIQRAVIVGSDCPALTPDHLVRALAALTEKDLVLGPASDGGYYLIGLRKPVHELFEGIAWGTGKVLRQTLRKVSRLGMSSVLLDVLEDVDRPENLSALKEPVRPNETSRE